MKKLILLAMVAMIAVIGAATSTLAGGTQVPGHARKSDADNNGIPDVGVVVNGHYTSVYAYDCTSRNLAGLCDSDWYWDLGDGRVDGSVASIEYLDSDTLTVCDYVVNYRATFENTPYMDSGWIQNHIRCHGYDDNSHYNYLIVHESDPRYTGNPDWEIWGKWEYHVLTESGSGNLVHTLEHLGP